MVMITTPQLPTRAEQPALCVSFPKQLEQLFETALPGTWTKIPAGPPALTILRMIRVNEARTGQQLTGIRDLLTA